MTKHTHPEARTTPYSRKQFLGAWCFHAVEQATGATRKLNTSPVNDVFLTFHHFFLCVDKAMERCFFFYYDVLRTEVI
jgi:hypothetical protein